jgi:hypothetical protein
MELFGGGFLPRCGHRCPSAGRRFSLPARNPSLNSLLRNDLARIGRFGNTRALQPGEHDESYPVRCAALLHPARRPGVMHDFDAFGKNARPGGS